MTDPQNSAPRAVESVVPGWLVLNVMAYAITDRRRGTFHSDDGGTFEQWLQAKAGDFDATHDDCFYALEAMEKRGWIKVDWDAEETSDGTA